MTIAKLKLDKSAKLEFGVNISGTTGTPESRFIIQNEHFEISYPCKPTSEGLEVNILALGEIFKAGEYSSRLEVIIDNKIYTPLTGTIEFEPNVQLTSIPKMEEQVVESAVAVSPISKVTVHSIGKPIVEEAPPPPVIKETESRQFSRMLFQQVTKKK